MILSNPALYKKMLYAYQTENKNTQRVQNPTQKPPNKKSILTEGIISRRATGTVKKVRND